MSDKPLVNIRGLHFKYDKQHEVLDDVSFDIAEGELITLLGPNGAGKSTLLNCIMGLLAPSAGTIELMGRNLSDYDPRSISQTIAYVQQSVRLEFDYTVKEYVAMGRAPHLKLYEKPGKTDYQLVEDVLERLGIASLSQKIYSQLSGGQRQLVDVAKAIVQSPKLVLFDEPTSALDFGNQMRVLKMVSELSNEGYAIVMTTHNPDHPILLKGSVCILDRKGKLKYGSAEDMVTEQALKDLYDTSLMVEYVPTAGRNVCIAPLLGSSRVR